MAAPNTNTKARKTQKNRVAATSRTAAPHGNKTIFKRSGSWIFKAGDSI